MGAAKKISEANEELTNFEIEKRGPPLVSSNPTRPNSFFIAGICSFLFFSAVGIVAIDLSFQIPTEITKYIKSQEEYFAKSTTPYRQTLSDTTLFDLSVGSDQEAMKESLFWIDKDPGFSDGVALKVLENPEVFSFVFPGYPDQMRQDKELWRLFNYDKAPKITMSHYANLPIPFKNAFIEKNLTGCLAIFRKYGADVLVIGSSESAQGIVPDQLHDRLSVLAQLNNPRILQCQYPNLPTQSVTLFAKEMRKLGKKIPIILWGCNDRNAAPEVPEIMEVASIVRDKVARFNRAANGVYEISSLFDSWTVTKGSSIFPNISFSMLMPYGYNRISEYYERDSGRSQSYLIADNLSVADTINEIEANYRPYQHVYSDIRRFPGAGCDIEPGRARINEAVAALRDLSPQVFVYLTTVSSMMTSITPPCVASNSDKLLTEIRRDGVYTKIDKMGDYGLNLSHYLMNSSHPGMLYFNIDHHNFPGALLLTNKLSDWIIGTLSDGSSQNSAEKQASANKN